MSAYQFWTDLQFMKPLDGRKGWHCMRHLGEGHRNNQYVVPLSHMLFQMFQTVLEGCEWSLAGAHCYCCSSHLVRERLWLFGLSLISSYIVFSCPSRYNLYYTTKEFILWGYYLHWIICTKELCRDLRLKIRNGVL